MKTMKYLQRMMNMALCRFRSAINYVQEWIDLNIGLIEKFFGRILWRSILVCALNFYDI